MADERDDTDRSEDPTQKRLDEALKRGDVVKSQEVNAWFVIAGATLILMAFSATMGSGITSTLRGIIANSSAIRVDGRGFTHVVGKLGIELLGAVMAALMWPERHRLDSLVANDPAAMLPLAQKLSLEMLGAVVAVLALVAAADYLFQYRQWFERQRMSVRELKEEFKQTNGNPEIKAKIRQIRQTRSRKRMMAAVPNASVVITNPTHFAVALRYERGMNAPICVAKGADLIARKIRAVAVEHAIPIVENPPLARALHGTVEIDEEIRPEHYQAVAEIIGYVMRLNRAVAGRR